MHLQGGEPRHLGLLFNLAFRIPSFSLDDSKKKKLPPPVLLPLQPPLYDGISIGLQALRRLMVSTSDTLCVTQATSVRARQTGWAVDSHWSTLHVISFGLVLRMISVLFLLTHRTLGK